MAGKYYWLKLKRDFFKRHDIQIIEAMPNGKDYILFYLKLLCESVDHEGNLRFSDEIPYNAEMLATITGTNVDVVRSAIQIFTQLHMMEIMDDGTFYMSEVEKMLGSETQWAEKKRRQRTLPQLTNGCTRLNAEMIRLPDGTTRFIDEKRYGGNGMFVLDRAGGKCEICGSTDNVVIHHNNGNSNDPSDLMAVCAKCHGKIHSKEYGGHFPPTVPTMSDKSKSKSKRKNINKSEYGEFNNVRLSDDELAKLKVKFPKDWSQRIEALSEYMRSKGKTYKDHYATILSWARKEQRDKPPEQKVKHYKEFEKEKEIDAVQMPDEIRERLGGMFNGS